MASTTSYIGPSWLAPDGADSYVDLTTWETAVQSGAALQTAILVADIVDNVIFSGWATGGSVLIKGDLTGNIKRKITSDSGGSHVIYPTSPDMSILTLQDLLIDCAPQLLSRNGIYCSTGFVTLTMERVTIKDSTFMGLYITNASSYLTGTIDNCIFDGNKYAIGLVETTAENITTFRNCLFAGTTTKTHYLATNANQIAYFYNCISFDNTNDDFDDAEKASLTYVNNCVSSDSSANDTNHTVPSLGNAITQTLFSTYFRNYNTGRFQLLNDDESLWTINGDSANTPDLDYTSRTRTNDDIGPYEFVSRTYGQLLLVDEAPDVDGVIEDEAGWEDNAQAVNSPCLTFDGATAFVNYGDDAAFDITDNLSAFIKCTNDNAAVPASQVAFSKYDSSGDKREWRIYIDTAEKIRIEFGDPANGTSEGVWGSDAAVLPAAITSIGFTFTGGTVVIYVDGIAVDSSLISGAMPSTLYNSTAPVAVGCSWGGVGVNSDEWDGIAYNARLYDTTILTAAEMLYLHSSGASGTDPGLTNLVFSSPMSENSGATAYDVSVNGNDGTITAATWGAFQTEFHWSLAKGFTLSGTVEVPALTNGTLDAQGNTITNPAGAWHNQGVTQISGIFDAVANWSYSGALSDPNFYLLDYSENAYAFSHGLGYIELGVSDDIVSIVGTPIGLQSLGNMSYSIGGRGPDTSVSLYADTTEVTGLGSRTKYIIQDNYLQYDGNQDIVSISGTNNGQQNLRNITYSFGSRTSVKDLNETTPTINIVDITGLYQSRFESYLEIVE